MYDIIHDEATILIVHVWSNCNGFLLNFYLKNIDTVQINFYFLSILMDALTIS